MCVVESSARPVCSRSCCGLFLHDVGTRFSDLDVVVTARSPLAVLERKRTGRVSFRVDLLSDWSHDGTM
jgi:hypothetical protein